MYVLEEYDNALRHILAKGRRKKNRTGVDTLSVTGMTCRYDISKRLPLLTRRRLAFRPIVGELLWYLSGNTNAYDLKGKYNCGVWLPWVSEKFERDKRFVEGALGPLYGFQAVDFGGQYYGGEPKTYPYIGQCNQIERMVKLLKMEPHRRDIMLSVYNPAQIDQMRLSPCHFAFQVLADVENKTLDGILYMRSSDFPVGMPNNIVFYSLLTNLFAQQVGFTPNELIVMSGDAHVYVNQIPMVEEMLSRPAPDSPHYAVYEEDDISKYTMDSFGVYDYNPLPTMKFPVAV